MSGRKEYIEYKLQKLHQEKLEQELEGIRSELSDYYTAQEQISIKRRRENIYVLFAIGIIGAFFTIVPRSSITIDSSFLLVFGIFVFTSALFLIIKINTVALTESSTVGGNGMDNILEYLFAFSINGSIILVIAVGLINLFEIQLDDIMSNGIAILTLIISTLTVYLLQVSKRRQIKRHNKNLTADREQSREELLNEIISNFNELRQAEGEKEQLEIFNELSFKIDQAEHEFATADEVKPISNELENLEGIPDNIAEVLREKFSETQESLRDENPEEESLEAKKAALQEEYEELAFESHEGMDS